MEHIALTVNILWQLWKARNGRTFNETPRHPMKIIQKAHGEWLEFTEVREKDKKDEHTRNNKSRKCAAGKKLGNWFNKPQHNN